MNENEAITRDLSLDPKSFHNISENFIRLMTAQMQKNGNKMPEGETAIQFADLACENIPKESVDNMILTIGSFLGETLNKIWGSRWHYSPSQERWVLFIKSKKGDDLELNIFRKVHNRMLNGEEDSILYWYESAKKMIDGWVPGN